MTSYLIKGGIVVEDCDSEPRRADVLVEGGRIARIGTDIPAAGTEIVDATHGVVIPGLVDTHRHTWQTPLRGVCGDMSILEYFMSVRWYLGGAFSPEDVYVGVLAGALEMVDAGITQVLDFSHCMNSPQHADAAFAGIRDSGIRAVFGYGFNEVPLEDPAFTSHDQRIADFHRIATSYFPDPSGLLTLGVSLSDYTQVGIEILEKEIRAAREHGARITLHPGAFTSRRTFDSITQLHDRGLIGDDMVFVHCNPASEAELGYLAEAGAHVSMTPETEMQMSMGFPVTNRILRLGMRPTVGVDVTSDGSGDLFFPMRLALQTARAQANQESLDRGVTNEHLALSCRDALRFATENGAIALGSSDRTGRLAEGMAADVVVLRSRSYELDPVIDPFTSAVLHANAGSVDTVLIDGTLRKRGGVSVDAEHDAGVRERLREVGRRIGGEWHDRGGLAGRPDTDAERAMRERLGAS